MTKQPVHGYLIDPELQTITPMIYSGLDSLYQAIGCELVDIVYINDQRDGVFVDDEGLIKDEPPTHYFYIDGCHSPLAGRGVVLGCDHEGESVSPTISADWLRKHVTYIESIAPFAVAVIAPDGDSARMQNIMRMFGVE